MKMNFVIRIKGSPTSGWYSPPKGTHSGDKHREVGSGKTVVAIKRKPAKVGEPLLDLVSYDDVKAYGESDWAKWRDDLSSTQAEALMMYAGRDYKPVNKALRDRGGIDPVTMDSDVVDMVRELDSIMVPITRSVEVSRIYDDDVLLDKFTSMKVGDTFRDDAYVSTSLSRDRLAAVFIRVPRGTKAAYNSFYEDFEKELTAEPFETELLLNRGYTFRKVGMDGDTPVLEVVV